MKKFTLKFEGGNTASKTIVDNLAPSYLDKMMPAIVGIEVKVERLENVFKLSQNIIKQCSD
jgi:transcriptional regulator